MDTTTAFVKLWLWKHAPQSLKELSENGGDEDYVVLIPPRLVDAWFPFFEEGTSFGCCHVQEHILEDGSKVLIGCHS